MHILLTSHNILLSCWFLPACNVTINWPFIILLMCNEQYTCVGIRRLHHIWTVFAIT